MGAGASVEDIVNSDGAKQREASDELFTRFDVIKDNKLNLLEVKKGLQALEDEGTVINLSAKKFAKVADADGDKMVDRDEFFAVMKKVFDKGDITISAPPEKTTMVLPPAEEQSSAETKAKGEDDAAAAAVVAPSSSAPGGLLGSGADTGSRAAALFASIDLNGNGSLSLSELQTFFGPDASEALTELGGTGATEVDASAWAVFFASLPEDTASAYLMSLEEIVAAKDLSGAAPPQGSAIAADGPVDSPVEAAPVAVEAALAEKTEATASEGNPAEIDASDATLAPG